MRIVKYCENPDCKEKIFVFIDTNNKIMRYELEVVCLKCKRVNNWGQKWIR